MPNAGSTIGGDLIRMEAAHATCMGAILSVSGHRPGVDLIDNSKLYKYRNIRPTLSLPSAGSSIGGNLISMEATHAT